MAESGKYILGVCSGFQALAKQTDIGRLSTIPVVREGLGLLDVEFKPLICTDRVKADVTGECFLTKETGKQVNGFHCHTYGEISLGSDAKPILVSHINRVNYLKSPRDLISGVSNKDGNVVGVLTHGLLDNNLTITQSIMKSLDINEADLKAIKAANAKLVQNIKTEVGIATGTHQQPRPSHKPLQLLLVTALGSGSGKTFIVTGIAGALKKLGYKVGVVKVGGDIRDVVPSLYLIKEPIRAYSSIKIGEVGWTSLEQVVEMASKDYDFLIVEGAMSAFTGLFMDKYQRPLTTAEVAAALGASTIMVAACNQEGLEGALLDALNNIRALKKLGVKTTGVILNKLHISYMTKETVELMEQAFAGVGVELLGMVPKLNLEHRGMIPEVEIRYEEFCAQAVAAAEKSLNLDLITKVAAPPELSAVNYEALTVQFKKLLLSSNLGGDQQ
jgi:cobyric acid synthase